MPRSAEVAHDLPVRLRAATAAMKDAKKAYELRVRQRDELVREAIDDHGLSQIAVADIIGVAKGRISQILAKPDDDE